MNVFVLSHDHAERAQYHCDTHVSKMTLEGVQILNTALHKVGGEEFAFYQPTHKNHPWCVWASNSDENWQWLYDHVSALAEEFQRRNGKQHESARKMREHWGDTETAFKIDCRLPNYVKTAYPICTGEFEPTSGDPVEAYREYYIAEKVPQDWCSWSTSVPNWVLEMQ